MEDLSEYSLRSIL